MTLDEKLLDQMNRLEMEEEEASRKSSLEKTAVPGVQAGVLRVNETEITFHRENLFDDEVSIMIPNTFALMEPDLAAIKYPSERRPDPIFANDGGSITMGFNHTASKMKGEEIEAFKTFLFENLKRMQSSVRFIGDGVEHIAERQVAYFEFISPALDSDIYNLMFFTDLKGRAFIASFNCLETDMELWQPIAKGMMASLQIEGQATAKEEKF